MKYTKPPLTFQQQATLLISRGLIVDNPGELENYLSQVNYYRLSGYWYEFKIIDPFTGDETLRPGTTFQTIRDRYEFDRRLRLLFMDALERIEVAIFRTKLVETNTLQYGPFGYTDQKNYNPKFIAYDLQKLLDDISKDEGRSKEEFITRYRTKYDEELYLPLWMAAELMSFGQLLTLYRNQHLSIKQTISHQYKLFPQVLDSWLLTLSAIRNSCAHHNRLWNHPLPLIMGLPDRRNDPRWYDPDPIPNNRLYTALTVINYLLAFIAPTDQWKESIKRLLAAYPTIPLRQMGIPENWQDSPLWN
jgi:abortive infection bacteriophage resistance protein